MESLCEVHCHLLCNSCRILFFTCSRVCEGSLSFAARLLAVLTASWRSDNAASGVVCAGGTACSLTRRVQRMCPLFSCFRKWNETQSYDLRAPPLPSLPPCDGINRRPQRSCFPCKTSHYMKSRHCLMCADYDFSTRERGRYYNPLPWVTGQRKAIFWPQIILRETSRSRVRYKIYDGGAEWLTFPSQWPLCLWSFLCGMSWLILLEFIFNQFPGEKRIHLHCVYTQCIFTRLRAQWIMSQSVYAPRKLLLPSSLCFGICGETKKEK